jgi:hypothetical protein
MSLVEWRLTIGRHVVSYLGRERRKGEYSHVSHHGNTNTTL